jgi:hypothetical protein
VHSCSLSLSRDRLFTENFFDTQPLLALRGHPVDAWWSLLTGQTAPSNYLKSRNSCSEDGKINHIIGDV